MLKNIYFVVVLLGLCKPAIADPIFRINSNETAQITKYNDTWCITNTLTTDIMVPTGTEPEFDSFLNHPWPGVDSYKGTCTAELNFNLDAPILDIAQQSDGKLILAGYFTVANWIEESGGFYFNTSADTPYILRLNADRTVDTSFTPPTFDGPITRIIVQPDDKILIQGYFSGIAKRTMTCTGFTRLNSDGTLDTNFEDMLDFNYNVGSNIVTSMALMSDNTILVAGTFSPKVIVMGTQTVAKLGPYGSDEYLADDLKFADTESIGLLNDDRIVAKINHATHLYSSGGVEDLSYVSPAFHKPCGPCMSSYVYRTRADGKVFVMGDVGLGGIPRRLLRLNANASLDTGYTDGGFDYDVFDIHFLPNNKTLVGGSFTTYGVDTVGQVIRLNDNGSLDPEFSTASANFDAPIYAVFQYGLGKIVLGGEFYSYGVNILGQPFYLEVATNGF